MQVKSTGAVQLLSLTAAATTATAAKLPDGFGIGSPADRATEPWNHRDLYYLRRGLAEAPIDAVARRRVERIAASAEGATESLALTAANGGPAAQAADSEAVRRRADFDRQVAAAWGDRTSILVIQDVLMSGATGSDYTLDTVLAPAGVIPTPAQDARIAPIIARLRQARERQEHAPAIQPVNGAKAADDMAEARAALRNVFTKEQLATLDAYTLRWLKDQAKGDGAGAATEP